MSERLYDIIEISDLKDMLNKTRDLYSERPAYKIKLEEGKYKTISHNEVREMVDSLRNSINWYGAKR